MQVAAPKLQIFVELREEVRTIGHEVSQTCRILAPDPLPRWRIAEADLATIWELHLDQVVLSIIAIAGDSARAPSPHKITVGIVGEGLLPSLQQAVSLVISIVDGLALAL